MEVTLVREIFSFRARPLKIPFSVSEFKSIISEKGMHGTKVIASSNGIMVCGAGTTKMIPCISKLYGDSNTKCSCKTAKKKYMISSNSKDCVICHREALDNFLNRKYWQVDVLALL